MASKIELKADADYVKEQVKASRAMSELNSMMDEGDFEDIRILEIRVKNGNDGDGSKLIIVKALVEGRAIIGFSSGLDMTSALRTALERIKNNSMKWRDDKPYGGA